MWVELCPRFSPSPSPPQFTFKPLRPTNKSLFANRAFVGGIRDENVGSAGGRGGVPKKFFKNFKKRAIQTRRVCRTSGVSRCAPGLRGWTSSALGLTPGLTPSGQNVYFNLGFSQPLVLQPRVSCKDPVCRRGLVAGGGGSSVDYFIGGTEGWGEGAATARLPEGGGTHGANGVTGFMMHESGHLQSRRDEPPKWDRPPKTRGVSVVCVCVCFLL